MAKRRGNPNWGKPEPIGPIVPTVTEFEQVVKEYKLTPDQYRQKWGLASDYPMVAPNYAEQRRTLAKSIGLGTKRRKTKGR